MGVTLQSLPALSVELGAREPQAIIAFALEQLERIAISFSGAEDVVLVDIATRIRPSVEVFCLDTGRLNPETLRFLDKVREHYRIRLDVLSPDAEAVERLVREKGLFSFYRDGHNECCQVRKVAPLRRKLASLDAWITGQRKDQSPSTRTDVPVIEHDTLFSTPEHPVIKLNPLANWSSTQVWQYIYDYQVPYNELHQRGFKSIGCEPCTRAVLPHQHEREGRWWWEDAAIKECGIHSGNLKRTP
jgi:phosphoadenosine phosphosulfate reductase